MPDPIRMAAASSALISPLALAHPGAHGGGALAELWHTLTSADHALVLLGGIVVLALIFGLAFRTRQRAAKPDPSTARTR